MTLPTNETKEEVFSKLQKLRDTKYKDISIKHDMTPLERQAHNKIVERLKKLEGKPGISGNFKYQVRGPPWRKYIIKLKKKKQGEEMKRSEVLEVIQLEDLHKLEKE